MKTYISVLCLLGFLNFFGQTQKKNVWIFTDMTDSSLKGNNHMGTLNDPDDISAMAGYLLMHNAFDTKGIVVGSTHRSEHKNTPNQAKWALSYFGDAYKKDYKGLQAKYGDYQKSIPFIQSSIMKTGDHFDPHADYTDLSRYASVKKLLMEVKKNPDTLNILIWGSTTEPAIFVKHLLQTNQKEILKRIRFIAHWTNSALHQGTVEHPEAVANCKEDSTACAFMKKMAIQGTLMYYELGAIGQHGIVSGAPSGKVFYDQFETSELGKIFINGKFVNNKVDHSDSATYWVLLGEYGVGLPEILSNGKNNLALEKRNELNFKQHSYKIHEILLERSLAAARD